MKKFIKSGIAALKKILYKVPVISNILRLIYRLILEEILVSFRDSQKKNNMAKMYAWMSDISGVEYIRNGSWEWNNIENVRYLLKTNQVKNKIFIDIGANIGYFTCNFYAYFNKIYAFEPNKIAFNILTANTLNLNYQFSSQCLIKRENLAISNSNGELYLEANLNNSLGKTNKYDSYNSYSVKAIRLDEYIENEKIKAEDISLIKIDVEGFETEVIKGALKTMKSASPIILVEMLSKKNNPKILEMLNSSGYIYKYSYKRNFYNNLLRISPRLKKRSEEYIINNSSQLVYFSKKPIKFS